MDGDFDQYNLQTSCAIFLVTILVYICHVMLSASTGWVGTEQKKDTHIGNMCVDADFSTRPIGQDCNVQGVVQVSGGSMGKRCDCDWKISAAFVHVGVCVWVSSLGVFRVC